MKRVQQFALKVRGVTVLRTDDADVILQEIEKHLEQQVEGQTILEKKPRLLKSP